MTEDDHTYMDQARRELVKSGQSELDMHQNLPGSVELWEEIQKLKAEMNKAKKAAAKEAAAPFLEQIEELEAQYALAIRLSV